MRRLIFFGFLVSGFGLPPVHATDPQYLQALTPRPWSFPKDHGRHDGFKTEWWYFTGNLKEPSTGRRFGYQLTFFRSAFTAKPATRPSPWAMTDIYFAHAAISDIQGNKFLYTDRLTRGRPGLASASDQTLDVTLKDWSAKLDSESHFHLTATDEEFAINLTTHAGSPPSARGPIFQGPGGLNPKGKNPGQASYYYSLTRMPTAGSLTLGDRKFQVEGLSWMDHEFSSNALGQNQVGWDWLALTLADGHDLMLYRLRNDQGQTDYLSGTLIDPSGKTIFLTDQQITLTPSGAWKSPNSGATYPTQWSVRVPGLPEMTIKPRLPNQELSTPNSGDIHYYEGAVEVTDLQAHPLGDGYLEMTGYSKPLKN